MSTARLLWRCARRTTTHATGRALGAALLLASGAASSAAQSPQPVVMVHGFLTEGSTWDVAAARVRREFNARTTQPTLGWYRPYGEQAGVLRGTLANEPWAFPDTTVLVGHSNGGLISREAVRQGQPAKAVVTVGSLHAGAPLALRMNVLPGWGGFIAGVNADPVWYYWYYMRDFNWVSLTAGSFNATMSAVGGFMSGYGSYVIGKAGFGVLPDMQTGSDAISRLNSGDNLAREAGTVPVRIGIQSYLDQPLVGVMFHGLLGANGGGDVGTTVQYLSILFDLLAYDYYSSYWWVSDDYYAYELAYGAHLWLNAAFTNAAIDPVWCGLVGVLNGTTCENSDGIVPLANQYYPNGLNYTVQGPSHTDQTSSRQTLDQIVSSLRYSVGVGAPVAPPPYEPPPDPPPYEPCGTQIICEPMMQLQSAPAPGTATASAAPSATPAVSRQVTPSQFRSP